ncbi:hypothetical protein ACTD5D_16250 [Nocardia takedensis]|uniref:hypothetical protein n=1 Tax=Nocardia takedensis TaxID=259390 RepID=UPI0003131ADE|nr:hypothetical protein [Nocardia takedensis]
MPTRKVVDSLCRTNIEYHRLHAARGPAAVPIVTVHPHGSTGFETGVEQRWTET